MKKLVALAALGCSTALASEAHADEWYGWQTLASDGTTVVATFAASKAFKSSTPAVVIGLTGYLAVPVTIHLLHDEPVRALGSGGLRLGAPLVLGVAAGLVLSRKQDNAFGALAAAAGVVVAATIGAIAASVIDAGAIAYESKDEPAPPTTAQPLKTISFGGSF